MIKFFAQHPTAANLLMVALLAIGIFALPSIRRETFPEYVPSEVEIRIAYPGATAEEVEEAVCQRVEDALDGINFVEEIRSDAREGFAIITVEMAENGHFQSFLNDIKKEILANLETVTTDESFINLVKAAVRVAGSSGAGRRSDSKSSMFRSMMVEKGSLTEDEIWGAFKWGKHETLSAAWGFRKKGSPEDFLYISFSLLVSS